MSGTASSARVSAPCFVSHFVAAGASRRRVTRATRHWRGNWPAALPAAGGRAGAQCSPALRRVTGRAAGPGTAATAALSPFPEEVRPDDDADAACRLVVRRL